MPTRISKPFSPLLARFRKPWASDLDKATAPRVSTAMVASLGRAITVLVATPAQVDQGQATPTEVTPAAVLPVGTAVSTGRHLEDILVSTSKEDRTTTLLELEDTPVAGRSRTTTLPDHREDLPTTTRDRGDQTNNRVVPTVLHRDRPVRLDQELHRLDLPLAQSRRVDLYNQLLLLRRQPALLLRLKTSRLPPPRPPPQLHLLPPLLLLPPTLLL